MGKIWYNTTCIGGSDTRWQREERPEPHVFVSADTRQKSSFVNNLGAKRKTLRATMNNQLHINHLTQFNHFANELRKITYEIINFFMQNEPNLPENQVNASFVLAKGYEADIVFWPKNPKANLLNTQMNVNPFITKNYENKRNWTLGENEPKTNPIQSQFKPNQSQFHHHRLYTCFNFLLARSYGEKYAY